MSAKVNKNDSPAEVRKEPVAIKPVPIRWCFPDNQVGLPASYMTVQFDGHDFHLSFFDVRPPMLMSGTSEDQEKAAEIIDHVDAMCVARLIINKSRIENLAKTLLTHINDCIGDQDGKHEQTNA